jgi:hypothetical protein
MISHRPGRHSSEYCSYTKDGDDESPHPRQQIGWKFLPSSRPLYIIQERYDDLWIEQWKREKNGPTKQKSGKYNEEPAKLNRDVALRAVRPNSLFSVNSCPKITHLFWQDFAKTYTIMHQKQPGSQDLIGFSYEKSAGRRNRQCFLFGKIL